MPRYDTTRHGPANSNAYVLVPIVWDYAEVAVEYAGAENVTDATNETKETEKRETKGRNEREKRKRETIGQSITPVSSYGRTAVSKSVGVGGRDERTSLCSWV